MAKKNKRIHGGGLVYSTNKETMRDIFAGINVGGDSPNPEPAGKTKEDQVRVWLDRKSRGGKEVTLVKGIKMPDSFLKEIAKKLKARCGVGGSVKNGEIIIQGNQRERVVDYLLEMGYVNTKKAGG